MKWFLRKLHISDYNSRHVLVTESDTGFGNLLVKHLDKLGVPVFACCLTEHGQKKLRTECSSNVFPLGLDVTKEESVKRCLKTVKEKLGDKGLVLICFLNVFLLYWRILQFVHEKRTMIKNLYNQITFPGRKKHQETALTLRIHNVCGAWW